VLRVCADPNNLPFSNAREQGFENRIAALVAADLGKRVTYVWWPQRRGFVRNTLGADRCDLVVGVPAGYRLVEATRPYYRSTYVFVARASRGLEVRTLDDDRLRTLAIGIHVVGDDYASLPPGQALTWRHIVGNLHGYPIQGDYATADPPRGLIDAVARGDVDVGLAWGPLAGYFARLEPEKLQVTPVEPRLDRGTLPMAFAIAMGVRRGDVQGRDRIQQAIDRHQAEIDEVLRAYGVPLLPLDAGAGTSAGE
jgi:quinoprotein dehydrogenase-associated probable ABC transporter substrate-binding protein